MELATKRYIGGVPRHLSVSGKSATVCTLYWRRSLAKAPLYRCFVHKTYGTPASIYSGCFSHFVYLGLNIFGVQNAIQYSHRARATPTPPTLGLNKTAACNISHGATTYILRSTTGSHNTHCGWAIWMRRCDALRAP